MNQNYKMSLLRQPSDYIDGLIGGCSREIAMTSNPDDIDKCLNMIHNKLTQMKFKSEDDLIDLRLYFNEHERATSVLKERPVRKEIMKRLAIYGWSGAEISFGSLGITPRDHSCIMASILLNPRF